MSTHCRWMGLDLPSPFILASLTLFSHTDLPRHIAYYCKCAEAGAGAIILPSVNPERSTGSGDRNNVKVRTMIIESGLKGPMGFTVQGPTYPNIISLEYGIALAAGLVQKQPGIPVIASIADIGTSDQFEFALNQLLQTPIDGIELYFSCPNALTRFGQSPEETLLSKLKRARHICGNIPISLKLSPTIDYGELLNKITDEVQGLTLFNAYIGLVPPSLESAATSPFAGYDRWAPTGIYGPQQRLLTYYHLYKFVPFAQSKGLEISCVGGFVNDRQAIQALLLGATTVQLSSVVAWHGIQSFQTFKHSLDAYLTSKNIPSVQSLIGISLPYIEDSVDTVIQTQHEQARMLVTDRCKMCNRCTCIDKLCLAISQPAPASKAEIDSDLCSGCGWCVSICPFQSIIQQAHGK
ncbi:MAG: hypothetical protein BGN88_13275 [Clostridiales bacterium 43-6]|nr:MAG: hypothetical protein BGN88_13275 [Clostridiales bacterium 43-6]